MLNINDPAPQFTLPSTTGKDVALSDLRGKKVVLYFYPKDETPGCTKESCDFRDNLARVKGHGALVFGVSRDTIASHDKFRAKYSLPFDLLSDPEAKVGKAYGAFGKKMMYGKPVTGTIRSTFLIDEKGRIAALWSPVRVEGHVDQVLAALAGTPSSGSKAPKATHAPEATRATDAPRSSATKTKRAAPAKTSAKKSTSPKPALPAKRKATPSAKATPATKSGLGAKPSTARKSGAKR